MRKFPLPAPPVLLVLAVVCALGFFMSREASEAEALPAFSFPEQNLVYVELSGCGLVTGVYQFNDGSSLLDVIKLTRGAGAGDSLGIAVENRLLRSGEKLVLIKKERKIEIVDDGWMMASQRIAMGIPLHPDRMTRGDWTVLPGIGERLAERIEIDRQNNGDFGGLDRLARVNGIGKARVESWATFF